MDGARRSSLHSGFAGLVHKIVSEKSGQKEVRKAARHGSLLVKLQTISRFHLRERQVANDAIQAGPAWGVGPGPAGAGMSCSLLSV